MTPAGIKSGLGATESYPCDPSVFRKEAQLPKNLQNSKIKSPIHCFSVGPEYSGASGTNTSFKEPGSSFCLVKAKKNLGTS